MWVDGSDRPTVASRGNHLAARCGFGTMDEALHGMIDATCSMECFGFYERARRGRICRRDTAIADRAPTLPKLGAGWRHRKDPTGFGRPPQRGRGPGPHRMICGWGVRSRENRGDWSARPSEAGAPGFMGIAVGVGLPLALRAEHASAAEVKLVEATLEERIIAHVP